MQFDTCISYPYTIIQTYIHECAYVHTPRLAATCESFHLWCHFRRSASHIYAWTCTFIHISIQGGIVHSNRAPRCLFTQACGRIVQSSVGRRTRNLQEFKRSQAKRRGSRCVSSRVHPPPSIPTPSIYALRCRRGKRTVKQCRSQSKSPSAAISRTDARRRPHLCEDIQDRGRESPDTATYCRATR